ncbi:MAG TPA: DUF4389 domain-containing protein [Conexibacter sp.]|nr:DUF4389 domain-containing protein [Conexibacter sp.]
MSHPVKLLVRDDLRRTRASVFFRLLLAIPHFIWLSLWGIAVFFAVIFNWFAVLVRGTAPQGLHGFLAEYLRYAVHVGAYVNLLADPYPKFSGDPGYAIDLEVAPPERQSRWTVFFRLLLVIPATLIGFALAGGYGEAHAGFRTGGGLLITVAFLGWFAALARANMPRGMRDAGAYALAYSAQLTAYLFILTDRYPDSDPLAALDDRPVREDPISLSVEDDLRRSRLTVFFRLLLAIPHIVWLQLWGIVALLALVVNWVATLFAGQSPDALHRFLAAYLRYQTHVIAFLTLTANPFPGFTGAPGRYPVDLVVAPRERQGRWSVLFRLLLAFPALLISGAYGGVIYTVAILGWFSALARGRMPLGMRNAAALSLRYMQQVSAYLWLLTPSYPYSGPTATAAATADPMPPAAPEAVATSPMT